MAFVQPNLWVLSGGGIQVRYSSATNHFHYHDGFRNEHFSGAEIRSVDVPDLGTLVSVTTFLTVDSGSSTFTVLLPSTNLDGTAPHPSTHVATDGITTAHHFLIPVSLLHGQVEYYTVTPLTGTASKV
jgi:hypothetical protein